MSWDANKANPAFPKIYNFDLLNVLVFDLLTFNELNIQRKAGGIVKLKNDILDF